jgi:replicative DNA helicase
MSTFSDFGATFQEDLAQLILEDRPFAEQISEILEIKYFEFDHLKFFIKKLFEHKKKYGTHPVKEMIQALFTDISSLSEIDQEMFALFIDKVENEKVLEPEFIKDTALEFCKKRKVQEAMYKCVEHLDHMQFDDIRKEMNVALNLGLDRNVGYDYIEDFEERYLQKTRAPISTGWPRMDEVLQGGHGRGELGVIIAPTGAGKSLVLTHLGAECYRQGKTVIYYTLELSQEAVGSRFDSCLTHIPLDELKHNKDYIREKISEFSGKLIIKEYPMRVGTVSMIKNHLEKLKGLDINPDMIIVDYADLMKPSRTLGEKRFEIEETYEELRGLAKETKAVLYTASQTNRSGLNAEIVTHESISEAFQKCFPADFIFTLSRTTNDKSTDSGRFFIAKNRNGIDGVVMPIRMIPAMVHIKILTPEEEAKLANNDTTTNNSVRDVKKKLSEMARNK